MTNNFNLISSFILGWEGGYVADPGEPPTNMGITLPVWNSLGTGRDLKDATIDDFNRVLIEYMAPIPIDQIHSKDVALMVADFFWGSGYTGIQTMRRVLGLPHSNHVDADFVTLVNSRDAGQLLDKLRSGRIGYCIGLATANNSKAKYLNGWINRINSIIVNTVPSISAVAKAGSSKPVSSAYRGWSDIKRDLYEFFH